MYILPGKPAGKETNLASVIDKRRLKSMGRRDDVDEADVAEYFLPVPGEPDFVKAQFE